MKIDYFKDIALRSSADFADKLSAMKAEHAKELIAGSVSGMANQSVCHPFDTIRTRLQMKPELRGPLDCTIQIVRYEGVAGFYKGFAAPFFAQAVYKSILFSVNSFAQKTLDRYEIERTRKTAFFCGSVGGIVNSLVTTPVELVRNQLMMQINDFNRTFNGPSHFVSRVYRHSKSKLLFIRQMYRGLQATIIRDGGGVGFLFLGFSLGLNFAKEYAGVTKKSELPLPYVMLSGSMGGIAFWSFALPFDGIKTRLQCVNVLQSDHRPRFLDIVRSMQPRDFYRGWQVALLRGIPGAATTLTVHHLVLTRLLNQEGNSSFR